MADDGNEATAMARSRSSSSSGDEGPPEITLDTLSAETLAALNAHLAVQDAAEVSQYDISSTLERLFAVVWCLLYFDRL